MSNIFLSDEIRRRKFFPIYFDRHSGIITDIISSLFILLFVYTSVSKLSNLTGFISVLFRSPLLSSYSTFVAWAIPITEILISCLLFFRNTRKWGLLSSMILMCVFTGYLIYMIYFTPNLPCSCGGVISQLSWKQHLIFNVIFTFLGTVGVAISFRSKYNR